MEGIVIFPLLLASLGLVFGICLRLTMAVVQLRLNSYLKPLKRGQRYACYLLASAICISFYVNAPILYVKFYGLPDSLELLSFWMEISIVLCLCFSSFLGVKVTDKVLTSHNFA